MKNVHIISKASPAELPPIINVALTFKNLGYNVVVFTQNTEEKILAFLEDSNITIKNLVNPSQTGRFSKFKHWVLFRVYIEKYKKEIERSDLIWISGADTIISLYKINFRNKNIFLQINELHEDDKVYWFFLKKIIPFFKKIIVASVERAAMYQVWFKLKTKPSVFPNKPYQFDFDRVEITKTIENYLYIIKTEKDKGKKIIIYQGFLGKDRDFSTLISVIEKRKNEFALVLMGSDYGMLNNYLKIFPEIIYIPQINAPQHLLITQHCDIGILNYLPISLNNIFCAPNKIWEYSNFGLVMIGNDIPGLTVLMKENIGVTCDIATALECDEALNIVINNFEEMNANSKKFFKENDLNSILLNIVDNEN